MLRFVAATAMAIVTVAPSVGGTCTDNDGDQFFVEPNCGTALDCNDDDPAIFPGAAELCDGFDNNCSNEIDEDLVCESCAADDLFVADLEGPAVGFVSPQIAWDGTDLAFAWTLAQDGVEQPLFQPFDVLQSPRPLSGQAPQARGVSMSWSGQSYGMAWWQLDGADDQKILFARLDKDGNVLSGPVALTASQSARWPSLVWNGSSYSVAWCDGRDGVPQIYFARFDRQGQRIGDEIAITSGTADAEFPHLIWTGSEYGLTWVEDEGATGSRWFTTLDASGERLTPVQSLTTTPADLARTAMAWNGTQYGLAWSDDRFGNPEILFTLVDDQAGLLVPPIRITEDNAKSDRPALDWNGRDFGLAWHDERGGDAAFYFKRLSPEGIALEEYRWAGAESESTFEPALIWTGVDHAILFLNTRNGENFLSSSRLPGCDPVDVDLDGYRACPDGVPCDCADRNALVYPGAPQICDQLNNDCLHPLWPELDESELDVDQDGISLCQGDNCPDVQNFSQSDVDGDGFGDFCDNCPALVNLSQIDSDLDNRGDACDNCPVNWNPSQVDNDRDGFADACDNCAAIQNFQQTNFDGDFQGDACDPDDGQIYVLFEGVLEDRLGWVETGFDGWNLYVGDLEVLRREGTYTQAPGSNVLAEQVCGLDDSLYIAGDPPSGRSAFYLVSGISNGAEGDLGGPLIQAVRANTAPCP